MSGAEVPVLGTSVLTPEVDILQSQVAWAFKRLLRKWYVRSVSSATHIRIAGLHGWLHCAMKGVPHHVRDNIRAAFPELDPREIDRIARRSSEFWKRFYLWRILACLPESTIPETWPVVGLEHLDAALKRKKGVLVFTAHFGYGRLVRAGLAAHGYQVALVTAGLSRQEERESLEVRLAGGSRLRRYIHARTRVLAELVESDDLIANLDVRPIFERLSNNGILMTTGDGLRSSHFVYLPLLGEMYPFPSGFMKIAMLTDAVVLPAFAVQDGRFGRIRLEIQPALPLDVGGDVEANVRLMANAIEEQLRRRPHLWRRWMIPNWFQVAREWAEGDVKTRYKSELKGTV